MAGSLELVATPGRCPTDLEPLLSGTARPDPGHEGAGPTVVALEVPETDGRHVDHRRTDRPPVRLLITGRPPGPPSGITVEVDSTSVTPAWWPVLPVRSDGDPPADRAGRQRGRSLQVRSWSARPERSREPAGPMIRLLGRVDLVGADWPLTSQQLSLLAFLACRGTADRASIVDALWDGQAMSPSRFPNLLSEVRARIGRRHLPQAIGGRYRLVGIGTDLALFEAATSAVGDDGDRELAAALELVRGPPLTGPGGRYWSWVEDRTDLSTEIEALIVDAAHGLALRSRSQGDLDGATRACRQGLAACPLDENLIALLARLHLEAGRVGSAHRLVEGWESRIRRLDCGEPSPAPRDVLRAAGSRLNISAA